MKRKMSGIYRGKKIIISIFFTNRLKLVMSKDFIDEKVKIYCDFFNKITHIVAKSHLNNHHQMFVVECNNQSLSVYYIKIGIRTLTLKGSVVSPLERLVKTKYDVRANSSCSPRKSRVSGFLKQVCRHV